MKLIFQNSNGEEHRIGYPKDWDEAIFYIREFVSRCNKRKEENSQFSIPYIRAYKQDGRVKLDVGSHTEFFFIEDEEFYDKFEGFFESLRKQADGLK